jgi:hypothetical protein
VSESEQQDPWAAVPPQNPAGPPAPPPGYAYPPPPPGVYYGYAPMQVRRTNALAIAALVCGICGFLYVVPAILGIVFGCIALRQIRREGSDGRGMAIAGIVTGIAWLVFVVVIAVVVIVAAHN